MKLFYQNIIYFKKHLLKIGTILIILTLSNAILIAGVSISGLIQNTASNINVSFLPVLGLSSRTNVTAEKDAQGIIELIQEVNQFLNQDFIQDKILQYHQIEQISLASFYIASNYFRENSYTPSGRPDYFGILGISTPDLFESMFNHLSLIAGYLPPNTCTHDQYQMMPVMISSEVAEINHLSLGSVFELNAFIRNSLPPDYNIDWGNFYSDHLIHETLDFQLEVVGVFNSAIIDNAPAYEEHARFLTSNYIFLPLECSNYIMSRINHSTINAIDSSPEYYLPMLSAQPRIMLILLIENGQYLATIMDKIENRFGDLLRVETQINEHSLISSTMDNLDYISNNILFGAVGLMIPVKICILILFVLDRKKEMDVYIVLGVKKKVLQAIIFVSIVPIMLFSVILGLGVSNLTTNNLFQQHTINVILNEQRIAQERLRMEFNSGFRTDWSIFDEIGIARFEVESLQYQNFFNNTNQNSLLAVLLILNIVLAFGVTMLIVSRIHRKKGNQH